MIDLLRDYTYSNESFITAAENGKPMLMNQIIEESL